MRRYRRLALALLILYATFTVGIHLHSHRGHDLVNPDCKLCQASNLSLIQTLETHCAPDLPVYGPADEIQPVSVLQQASHVQPGRAPPAA